MLKAIISNDKNILPPSHLGDVGFDLIAAEDPVMVTMTQEGVGPWSAFERISYLEYDTGIKIQPPKGHFSLIFPRSSISNYDLIMANSVGVIDESYRGTLKVRFKLTYEGVSKRTYKKGDKIAQLVFIPAVIPTLEVGELEKTSREEGGFGSTGQ